MHLGDLCLKSSFIDRAGHCLVAQRSLRLIWLEYKYHYRQKMKQERRPAYIYWIEAIGFGAIIALSWLNELSGLPGIIFGEPAMPNWHEAVMETLIALLVWLAVYWRTRKVLKRYLEEFLRVCAWCRKIGYNQEWIPLEEYFHRELATTTSHGICPDCAKKYS
jgi:hypothetical protein